MTERYSRVIAVNRAGDDVFVTFGYFRGGKAMVDEMVCNFYPRVSRSTIRRINRIFGRYGSMVDGFVITDDGMVVTRSFSDLLHIEGLLVTPEQLRERVNCLDYMKIEMEG